jgi:hypothetical protein
MTIVFRKKEGKPHAMQCIREGQKSNQIWQRSDDFYIFHDLIHYAVETKMPLENGFFGMLKSGISIHDFEGARENRPKLTFDAILAETLVGVFQHEFSQGQSQFEDFIEHWKNNLNLMGVHECPRISEDKIEEIRLEIKRLLEIWQKTPVNEALELIF